MKIYHLVSNKDVKHVDQAEGLVSSTLASQGFSHCCFFEQIIEIANSYFKESGVVVYEIDVSLLKSKILVEKNTKTESSFPHVHGVINKESVIRSFSLEQDSSGYRLPGKLLI